MKKRKNKWLLTLLIFAILQFGGLFALDRFLKQPEITDVASEIVERPKITSAPAEAVKYLISEDGSEIAYTTANNELVIADAEKKELFREVVGNVTYLHWLSKSNALLYVVDKQYSQQLYLLQTINLQMAMVEGANATNNNAYKLLKHWNGNKRTIENVYFSPYVEFFNIHVKNGTRDELYKYKAGSGLYQIPIYFKIQSIEYDDRNDIMTITTVNGDIHRIEDLHDVPVKKSQNNTNNSQQNNQNNNQNNNPNTNQNNNPGQNNNQNNNPIVIGK